MLDTASVLRTELRHNEPRIEFTYRLDRAAGRFFRGRVG